MMAILPSLAKWRTSHASADAAQGGVVQPVESPSPLYQPPPPLYAVAKRVLDVAGAIGFLLMSAPIWLAIAIAIRLDSPGPVLFRQVRIGRNGRPFVCFKFRTMYVDCDDGIHRAYTETFMRSGTPSELLAGKAYFKLRHDPRITRVGQVLRKTSLDELPNLLNVIRAEMSLVGPRPALPYEVERYEPWHRQRLSGLPGLTGIWQVYGRSRVPFDEMVRMDITYLQRPSIQQDLKLLLLTPPILLSRIGAD